ncbi:MAG: SDR family NAD(P)-dependent oxidoreductase [Cellvibrionaceae bacterium]
MAHSTTNSSQSPRVVLVTGASRGAGKGIARALGACGDIVYVTGRTTTANQAPLPGTIFETADIINNAGGTGIAVVCDHQDDQQVEALFKKIELEQGRLDILVNNAALVHDDLIKPGGFWEKSMDLVGILDVGLRSAYVASYHAAKIMSQQTQGLFINTGSFGAQCYMHGPAYGAQKAGLDKMTWDMAHDLRPYKVATVSLWMGMLDTERSQKVMAEEPEKYAHFADICETPDFTGRLIDALYRDPLLMKRSGRTYIGAELSIELGVSDLNGRRPLSHREMLGSPLKFNTAVVE